MVVFQYGSAVLFNVEDDEADLFLNIVRRHASGLLQEMRKDGDLFASLVCISFLANSKTVLILMMMHKCHYFHLLHHILTRPDVSDYAVKEKPELAEDVHGGPDCIFLKCLDTDAIHIIGSVLGQIALDYFVSQVDGMVEEFAEINRAMEKTGTFTMRRKKLFQLVGKANSNLTDIILKVGLFDRSEIAWREAKYAVINEYMPEEYEVNQQFGNLDLKLKFVEHNIHFLQEALQNRKSHLLEWCVIYLLTIQNVLSVYEIVLDSTAAGAM